MGIGPGVLAQPQLTDLLDAYSLQISRNINCMMIGKIVSFDKTTNTAKVQIASKRKLATGQIVPYPVLADCPVVHLQGGGAFLEFPITAGDTCMVLFSDRSIDSWFVSGSIDIPDMARVHSLSDGVVLVGVQPKTSALVLTGDGVNLNAKTHKLTLQNNDCSVSIDNGLKLNGKAKKLSVKNNAKNLKAILEAMLDAIVGATGTAVVDPGTHAGTCAITANPNISTVKLLIAQLLED